MNPRIAQADALLVEYGWEVAHARHVRDLALALFDQLQSLHELGSAERDLLEAAALLHDIGWTVSGSKHHKHSYRLIHDNGSRLTGFTLTEIELIANVARYHRKALPSLGHDPYANLPAPQREVVQRLAALLRLADGLDRPHWQTVTNLQCRLVNAHVEIVITAPDHAADHIAGAARKRDLFETVFARPIEFIAQPTSTA